MVSYLLTVTRDDADPNPFADKSGVDLLNLVILAEFYDLALYLVHLYPALATLKSPADNTALNMLAGKPSTFLRKAPFLSGSDSSIHGLNLVLRLAWLQTVFHYNFGNVDYRVTMSFLAALEVVRRGQWNFYRLENEHLNNAGKFRAVKTVPLPFHEVDEVD